MNKIIIITLLILSLFYSRAFAQITPITNTAFENLVSSSLVCDETKVTHRYKNDYLVIYDHFKNTQSYDLYLRKYKAFYTGNFFSYNLTSTNKDTSSINVFNRPELIPIGGKIVPNQEVRHLTTAEEYIDKYGTTDNASFNVNPVWTFSGATVQVDNLDGYAFGNPNARNISTPANNNPTKSPSYDDIVKFATMYDTDANNNTSDNNVAIIQCQKLLVRWCGDGLLGFTGDDGIAGTGDDESYTGVGNYDIYHGEECDDGNNNNSDGCSSTCKIETPNVTLTATPSSSTSSYDAVIDSTKSSRSKYIEFNDGKGNITSSGITFPVTKNYISSSTPTTKVISTYSGFKRPDILLPTNNASTSISIGGGGGGGGGTGVCGDGTIDTPNSSGVTETCDDGNATSGDGCSATCSTEGGGGGGGGVCSNGIIESSESCETHQYIHHNQICGTGTGAYDCSYTSLDPIPTVTGCRASDCRYCGDSTLEDTQGEECDNTQSWCSGSCSIDYGDPTGPGGSGARIIYDPKKIVGDNQPVYPGGTDKPKLKNITGYPINIIKNFCIERISQKNNHGNNFTYGESIDFNGGPNISSPNGVCKNVGRLEDNGIFFDLTLNTYTSDWKGRTDDFRIDDMYVDNNVASWLDNDNDGIFDLNEPNEEKIIRVSVPSVSTVGGGTSMIDSKRKGDLYYLASNGVSNQSKNNNFIVGSLSATSTTTPLSSYTIKSDNGVIKNQAIVEGDKDISSFDSIAITTSTSTIYNISSFNSYNGLSNVFYYRGDVILNSTHITGGNKTFIVDGNLTLNGNITSSDSIAFVVKGGMLTIGNIVTKIDGVYISMEDKIQGDGIKTFNKLLVTGALYGNIDDLVRDRTFINDNGNGLIDVGTIVHYTSKVYTTPPPLLGDFIGQYMEVWKISTDR